MEPVKIASPGQYLTFVLKGQCYGVPIGVIREINRVGEITAVPQTPAYVAGVMNLRGKIIPVVNLRQKLGLGDAPFTRDTCIIVMEAGPSQIGAIVDSVMGVVELATSEIEPRPAMGGEDRLGYVSGMGKTEGQVIILLDAVQTLAHPEVLELAAEEGSRAA